MITGEKLILNRAALAFVITIALGTLAACETAEERAEKFYESALSLLEEGDQERAILEFRNVFKLNGQHVGARSAYAALQRERGNIREALGQYLRLVEQAPDNIEGLIALAELNAQVNNWEAVKEYTERALVVDAGNPVVQALNAVVAYSSAQEESDEAAAASAVQAARDLESTLPDYKLLRQVAIDSKLRDNDVNAALREIDSALLLDPSDKSLHQLRLRALGSLGDSSGIEDQLKEMVAQFPDDPTFRATLVRWYVSRDQPDLAQEYLRSGVDIEAEDTGPYMNLVRFLVEIRGPEAAIEELDASLGGANPSPIFGAVRAGLIYETVDRESGISDLQSVLDSTTDEDQKRDFQVALARMLIGTDNSVGARALVEEVLAADSTHVEALKLKSGWLIDDDKVGEAIVALRTALDVAPSDADVMMLMARAYERDGNQELVGEMLALAVDASNSAPQHSIRYANYLSRRDKNVTAEEILIDALRIAPRDEQILSNLGQVYIRMKDWSRAEQVAATLNAMESEQAKTFANSLTTLILQGQQKNTEAVQFLENLVQQGQAGAGAQLAIVRSYLAAGQLEKARQYADNLLASNPTNPDIRFIAAATAASLGDVAEAETVFRELLEENDKVSQIWVALYRSVSAQSKPQQAQQVVNDALSAMPENATFQWIQAGLKERAGDVQGAINIYESMYAKNSNNPVIANNLASLITMQKTDAESVDRAFAIARRLRNIQVAPYQDTYGWISYLRGDYENAVVSLEPAAVGLANDPLVQFHLAKTYVALERFDDAVDQFKKVVALTGAADSREFVEESRTEINRLQAQ